MKLQQLFLVAMTVLGWLALGIQMFLVIRIVTDAGRPPIDGVINTLSYFTILTNLLVAIVVSASALRDNSDTFLTRPSTMSATALYIFVVGLIYSLVLRALWEPTGLQRAADVALHDLMPILYVLYWLLFVPKGTLRWSQPIYWLIYPTVYFIYSLLRGAVTGQYLYPFGDVNALGHATVLINGALLLGVFFVLGLIVVAVDHAIARFRGQPGG
jgi:hypothetical protein